MSNVLSGLTGGGTVASRGQLETLSQAETCPLCGNLGARNFLNVRDRFHLRSDIYRLVRCDSCTCVWLYSPPALEEMSFHYSQSYHRTIAIAGETSARRRWRKQIRRISRHKQSGNLLDVGCSSGGFLGALNGSSWKLHGIEMEESTARTARSVSGAEIFVGDALDAPFPANSFDVITSFDLLEHIYEPRVFLTKIQYWLKPGGIFYTVVPNIDSWEARLFRSYWYGLEAPRHLFHFSPQSLRVLMMRVGLSEVEVTTSRTTYVERSARYCFSSLLQRTTGISLTSQAELKEPGIAWKALRKPIRLAIVNRFGELAALAGAGASIEAVFKK